MAQEQRFLDLYSIGPASDPKQERDQSGQLLRPVDRAAQGAGRPLRDGRLRPANCVR